MHSGKKKNKFTIAIIVIGSIAFVVALFIVICLLWKKVEAKKDR